jgi:sulfide dehydrogenase cytochrome subunit
MPRLLWSAAIALCGATTAHAADVSTLVKDCEGCHGNNGVSEWSDVPTIAGISAGVHGDYLLMYRDKERPCVKSKYRQGDTKRPETDMCAVAAKLSDADIEALAAHFAAKPFVPAKQQTDPAKAAAGRKLHARDCEKCHTGNGRDADADASVLAGQWMPYLQSSFKAFASGERPQPKKMKEKMDKLQPADIEALVHFYGSQQ